MSRKTLLVAAAVLSVAAAARARQLEVIFCEIPTSPKSVVPGALDLTGVPEATNFRALEDLFVSPNGSRWMIKGRTQQGSDEENIMLLGSVTSGTMFAQEGQPVHAGVAGELYDFFGSGVGRFNSLDQFAYSARAREGVASVFQKVIFWDGTNFTMATQMGALYFGCDDLPPNPIGDEIVGNSIGSIHVLDNGAIGAHDTTIGNIHSSKRPAIFYDNTMFHQSDTTSVTDFAGTGSVQIDSISSNTFYTAPDGAHWIAIVDVDPTVSSLLGFVYDGRVRLQVNQPVPGAGFSAGAINNATIAANGDWFARGRDNSGTSSAAPDWAVRTGTLIAKTGDSITGGAETYGDTFYAFTGNAIGDWVLVANTSEPNVAMNEVIVWNGQIVVREGDPVDVDGNGSFDDDAFIGRASNASVFQADDIALTDDNVLFFLATLKNGAGADLGSNPAFGGPDVFIRLAFGPFCGLGVSYCTAGTTSNNCVPSITGIGTASASTGGGFTIAVNGLEGQKQGLIFYGLSGSHGATWGGGTSFLCVKAPTQRTPVHNSGGTINACDGVLSVDWNDYIATHPTALGNPFAGGETVWAQGWFRDPPAPKTTNLSDGLEFTVCP